MADIDADKNDMRRMRSTLFVAFAVGVPCLWVPVASAGVYPLVVIAIAMFVYGPVLAVLTLVHVVFYSAVFLGLAHLTAAVIHRSASHRVRMFVMIVVIGLIGVPPFLLIWGGASHGGDFPYQTAFEATRQLLFREP